MRTMTELLMLSLIMILSGCEIEGEDGFPPQLTVITPASGDTIAGLVLFNSIVQDNIAVDRVELLVDGIVHFTADSAPWQCEWQTYEYESGREYEVILRAWDQAGNYDQCDPLLLTLDNSHIDPHQAWLLPPHYDAPAQSFTLFWKANHDWDFELYTLYESGEPDMRFRYQIHTTATRADTAFVVDYSGRSRFYQLAVTDSSGLTTWSNIQETNPDIRFSRTYSGAWHETSEWSVLQTYDGGFIVAGGTQNTHYPLWEAFLLKTDARGDEIWRRVYDDQAIGAASSIRQTGDGGFIAVGSSLFKTDESGEVEWVNEEIGGHSLDVTIDGGYIILGYDGHYSNQGVDLIKTDRSGAVEWVSTFSGETFHDLREVQQTSDRGYIITGSITTEGDNDLRLLKTDEWGEEEWNCSYGDDSNEIGYSVLQTADGGFVAAGTTWAENCDAWLLKTDNAGNMEWNRRFGGQGHDGVRSVRSTFDGGYMLTGYTDGGVWLIKTSSVGQQLWDQRYCESEPCGGSSGQQTADGGFIITGSTGYSENLFLIKTDPEGNVD